MERSNYEHNPENTLPPHPCTDVTTCSYTHTHTRAVKISGLRIIWVQFSHVVSRSRFDQSTSAAASQLWVNGVDQVTRFYTSCCHQTSLSLSPKVNKTL